jgi:hypothetical protein
LTPLQFSVTQEEGTEDAFNSIHLNIKMNITIAPRKESTHVWSATADSSLLLLSLIAEMDGLPFSNR